MDFQGHTYRRYGNAAILEFEKYLTDNKFDLNNFVYLDTDQTYSEARYTNSGIRLFKYSNEDKDGMVNDQFHLTKCFMTKDKAYIDQ